MRLLKPTPILIGFSVFIAALTLTSCEDDPILAPHSGGKQTNGSYGNIAVAPPVDRSATDSATSVKYQTNPEVY